MLINKITMAALALICLAVSVNLAHGQGEFCWRDSYRRGIGRIPGECAPGREKIGALCYEKCPTGFRRSGFACRSECPDDFRDDGLFCRKEGGPYKRTGYGRKPGDGVGRKADRKKRERCEKDHGAGNCEKSGLRYYLKCRSGYESHGIIGLCRQKKVDCEAVGLEQGILRLSCRKKVIRTGLDPDRGVCGSNEEQKGLLGRCFKKCKAGYKGVGPVCWGQPPPGWNKCGMGASNPDKTKCAEIILNQLEAVGMFAFNIATLGGAKAVDIAADASQFAKLKNDFEKFRDMLKQYKKNNPKFFRKIREEKKKELCGDLLAFIEIDATFGSLEGETDASTLFEDQVCSDYDEDELKKTPREPALASDPSALTALIDEGIEGLDLLDLMDTDSGLDELESLVASTDPIDVDLSITELEVEDIARLTAQIAGLVDPTGVADLVAAFSYPNCNKLFDGNRELLHANHYPSRVSLRGTEGN